MTSNKENVNLRIFTSVDIKKCHTASTVFEACLMLHMRASLLTVTQRYTTETGFTIAKLLCHSANLKVNLYKNMLYQKSNSMWSWQSAKDWLLPERLCFAQHARVGIYDSGMLSESSMPPGFHDVSCWWNPSHSGAAASPDTVSVIWHLWKLASVQSLVYIPANRVQQMLAFSFKAVILEYVIRQWQDYQLIASKFVESA